MDTARKCEAKDFSALHPQMREWFASAGQRPQGSGLMSRIALPALLLASVLPFSARADIRLPGGAPPQVDAVAARVLRGGSVSIGLRGHFGGAGAVIFRISRPPSHGKLSQLRATGGNGATILYTSVAGDPESSDDFAYVIEAGGRASSPAEVHIEIDDPPAKLQTIEALDFGEIQAGQSAVRELPITNSGGGRLQGKITVSSPWRVGPGDFCVKSGKTETVRLAFEPNEAKAFVGQVTLQDDGGSTSTVSLRGIATPALCVLPATLLFGTEPRVENMSLTNLTNAPLKLTFNAGEHLETIDAIALAANETREVAVKVRPEVKGPVRETMVVNGPRFQTPVTMEIPPFADPKATPMITVSATPPPVAELTASPSPSAPPPLVSEQKTPSTPAAERVPAAVRVTLHRLDRGAWELRWPSQSPVAASYRVEERCLSFDRTGKLQTAWRPLPANISARGNPLTAKVRDLDGRQVHVLRVTALDADGRTLWESPAIALAPLPTRSHARSLWLVGSSIALAAFLLLRWRTR